MFVLKKDIKDIRDYMLESRLLIRGLEKTVKEQEAIIEKLSSGLREHNRRLHELENVVLRGMYISEKENILIPTPLVKQVETIRGESLPALHGKIIALEEYLKVEIVKQEERYEERYVVKKVGKNGRK